MASSPASEWQCTVRCAASTRVTVPMMKRQPPAVRSISRTGTTTCSGKTEAPTASGSMGLKVV